MIHLLWAKGQEAPEEGAVSADMEEMVISADRMIKRAMTGSFGEWKGKAPMKSWMI